MLRIAPAFAADAATIAHLSRHVHQLHLDNLPHFFRQSTDAEVEAALGRMLAQANVRAFIAYMDDAPAGYVLAMVNERPANEFCHARRYVLVDQISVEPEWARQGIGQQLVQAVVDYARSIGVHELEAHVWAFNDRSQAFFQAFGFAPKTRQFWMMLE